MSNYRYLNGDHKHPYEYKPCKACEVPQWIQKRRDFCSRTCSKKGSNNPQWGGEEAGYVSLHARVYRLRGTASHCAWGCEAPRYEWANLMGNYADPEDYAPMCCQCHARFDGAISKCFDKVCGRGHILNDETMYKKIGANGKEARQCKICARDRAKAQRSLAKLSLAELSQAERSGAQLSTAEFSKAQHSLFFL